MTQQLISVGQLANDGTGDTLRNAGLKINDNFTELYANIYKLPTASTSVLGGVKVDGSTINISNGVISAIATTAAANTLTGTTLANGVVNSSLTSVGVLTSLSVTGATTLSNSLTGLLKATSGSVSTATAGTDYLNTNSLSVQIAYPSGNGSLSYANNVFTYTPYSLQKATTSTLGGVIVDGTTITINNSTGVISGAVAYSLPTATTSILGGVIVDGTSITINGSGVISAGVSGTVVFKGTWNASTNTPTLASGSGTQGWQYAVNVAGTQNLGNGTQTYNVGDFVIYDGANWIDISGSTGVATFNSRSGAVTLTSTDVTTALGFTPIQKSSLSVATTTASGGGTLSYTNGTFTFAPAVIPTYTVSTNTASGGGSLSLNGTTFTFTPAVQYTLPTATTSTLGGIKIDNNTIVINNGVISVGGALTSATIFKGSWDASANNPNLSATTPAGVQAGWEYIVSVAGTRNIGTGGTSTTYNVGDLVIYDGTKWAQIPGSNAVQSFNTRSGAITLTSGDVTTALGFTPISSLSVTSNSASGTTSTLTYNAGVLTFTPASASSILSGVSIVSSHGFTGSNDQTGAITLSTSVTGLLKGNGTSILAATAGTDYQSPVSATGLLKSNGTSGNVSAAVAGTDYFAPASTTANYVLASPNGSAGTPTFRALVNADLPTTITATAATATTTSTAASLGYIGMPQQSKSSAYTTVIGDQGKHIYVTSTATITIDSNANVAYPIGTTIAFIAGTGATVTIAITSDTMYLGGTGTTGSRTLAPYGMATAVKVAATTWFINGTGLT